jgi:hypothetical protein
MRVWALGVVRWDSKLNKLHAVAYRIYKSREEGPCVYDPNNIRTKNILDNNQILTLKRGPAQPFLRKKKIQSHPLIDLSCKTIITKDDYVLSIIQLNNHTIHLSIILFRLAHSV